MAKILRGEIYWADLNPVIGHEQGGLRPVLIISQNIFNEKSGTVIAIALTSQTQKAGYPLTYQLNDSKLPKIFWVKISQIRTLSIKRIGKKISKVSDEELSLIIEGLNDIIGF
jgi:mRNA interferase MazF